jgi:hypothetical protein
MCKHNSAVLHTRRTCLRRCFLHIPDAPSVDGVDVASSSSRTLADTQFFLFLHGGAIVPGRSTAKAKRGGGGAKNGPTRSPLTL